MGFLDDVRDGKAVISPAADAAKTQKGTAPAAPAEQSKNYDAAAVLSQVSKSFWTISEQLKVELEHVAAERRHLADERQRLNNQHRVLVDALEKEAARLVLKVQASLGEIVPTSYQTVTALQTLRTVVTKVTPKIVLVQIAAPAVIATAVSAVIFIFAPVIASLIK